MSSGNTLSSQRPSFVESYICSVRTYPEKPFLWKVQCPKDLFIHQQRAEYLKPRVNLTLRVSTFRVRACRYETPLPHPIHLIDGEIKV